MNAWRIDVEQTFRNYDNDNPTEDKSFTEYCATFVQVCHCINRFREIDAEHKLSEGRYIRKIMITPIWIITD